MTRIDLYSAIASQQNALSPETALLDARTEIDRLGFLSDFAALINFYDSDNQVNGNWAPFLLKDPAILLAHMARTNLEKFRVIYRHTCKFIESKTRHHREIAWAMNHLFDQVTHLFMRLERWTHYMQASDAKYEMKTYLLHQVKNTYSAIFWAIIGLRDSLAALPYRYKVEPAKHYLFTDYDEHIWKQNAGKCPFWDILGLIPQITQNSPKQVYQALKNISDQVLNFLTTVIAQAAIAYEQVKLEKSKFPDTLLLRAFTNLLKVHQQQLNEITAKHLDFYFQDVLKQSPRGAMPDSAYIYITAAKKDAAFTLPEGTLFDAGLDEQKKPVQFSSAELVTVNPATISAAYTVLAIGKGSGHTVYIGEIPDPGTVKKDESGRPVSYKTFGSTTSDSTLNGAIIPKSGLTFSSPILLLQEGERTIQLSFTCDELDRELFTNASVYLSTASNWVKLTDYDIVVEDPYINQIFIRLSANVAPIAPFTKNPENIDAKWPVLKIEFDALTIPQISPKLKIIQLSVTAYGVSNFQLYNDYGGISAKTPFQPFGATPLLHSNFIIGSPELFSKPLDRFNLTLKWDNLPLANDISFDTYYQQYNRYLNHCFDNIITATQQKRSWWRRFILRRKRQINIVIDKDVIGPNVFTDTSFIADFKLLQAGSWLNANVFNLRILNSNVTDEPNTKYLFQTNDDKLQPISNFYSEGLLLDNGYGVQIPFKPDPAIQDDLSFKFSDKSTSGFIKIVLNGNPYGFGSNLYGSVVAQIATYNAWLLYHQQGLGLLAKAASLPFAPRLASISADYTATADESYPYAGYFYSPLNIQPIRCDPQAPKQQIQPRLYPWAIDALKLPEIDQTGMLLLAIDNLVPAESISLYLELTGATHLPVVKNHLQFFYQNTAGWGSLALLSDGTDGFSHSGIVKLNIPSDAVSGDFLTVKGKYAIAIMMSGAPETAAKLISISTNGLLVNRHSAISGKPTLAAGQIKKTVSAMPQIAAINQPFASFGGAGAETPAIMQRRVTGQLKTKDRAISREDYARLIQQKFPDIYYTSLVYKRGCREHAPCINIFVAGKRENLNEASALLPSLNPAYLQEIKDYLKQHSSGTCNIQVMNFCFMPVTVNARVLIKPGFFPDGVAKAIGAAIDIYLSPWIAGGPQPAVVRDLSIPPLVTVIKNITGVKEIESAKFIPLKTENTLGAERLYVTTGSYTIDCHGNAA